MSPRDEKWHPWFSLDKEADKNYNSVMIKKLEELVNPGTEEYALAQQINPTPIPVHLAVIMDGNGRWAKQRGLKREEGHKEGTISAEKIIEYSLRTNIKYLTLFTFSSENWKRPLTEINTLMNMFHDKLIEQKELLLKNDIRLSVLGEINRLPGKLRKKLQEIIELTRNHKTLQLNLALNYGSRQEILLAVKHIIEDNIPAKKINEDLFKKYLFSGHDPDPDLVIRTSGELRISNFLLFQCAYAEYYFTPIPWPDFRLAEFLKAILEYQHRERRFGKV